MKYKVLKSRSLTRLRDRYRNMKLIVIDEVSFLSYEVLRIVNCRLQEVGKRNVFFGDFNILRVGISYFWLPLL